MEFNKNDLNQMENLIKALKKGSFTLEGLEVLAMADCFKWLNRLLVISMEELKSKEQALKLSQEQKPVEADLPKAQSLPKEPEKEEPKADEPKQEAKPKKRK